MKKITAIILISTFAVNVSATAQTYMGRNCPQDPNCINNPFGAGSPYKSDGFNNPYSANGSPYSNKSPNNPYATNPPKLYDENGKYMGLLSDNPYLPDSTSNPNGKYGNPNSSDSINNPYGAGSPYTNKKVFIVPQ